MSDNDNNNIIIPCKHDSKKTTIRVDYNGIKKTLDACHDCLEVIKLSSTCKILEVLS